MTRLAQFTPLVLAAMSFVGLAQQVPSQAPGQKEISAPSAQAAQAPQELVVGGKVVGKQVKAKPGEICLLCNKPLGDGDVVYLVHGQRVPVHLDLCLPELREHTEHWLAQLQPRGAFLGAERSRTPPSGVWFFAGVYILLCLLFAAMSAHHALHAGYSPVAWFGIGLLLNALGYLWLLTRPRREVAAPAGVPRGLRKIAATYAPQPCPGCGSRNHPAATQCAGCGGRLEPKIASEVAKAGVRAN